MTPNSRSYLKRMAQPDSIVPDATKPISWNRYAYVGNNPVNNTDPDGHCFPLCTMAIGAAIGAMAGGIAYTIANHGQNFDYKEFAVAVGVGLVAGGLIGTGIGIGMAAAGGAAATVGGLTLTASVAAPLADASITISAGTAGLVTGGTYIASNPGKFETGNFVFQTGTSMIAAGASGDPAVGYWTRAGTNILAAEAGYYTNGQETHSLEGALITAGVAAVVSIPNGQLPSSSQYIFPVQTARNLTFGTINGFISGVASNAGSYLGGLHDALHEAK